MGNGITLDEIVRRNARRYPQRRALVAGNDSVTWVAFDRRIDCVAHALRDAGLAPGDRVVVLLSNCSEYLEIYFGAARAGIIIVPLNYRLELGELQTIVDHVSPTLLIAGCEYGAKVDALLQSTSSLRACWIVGRDESPRLPIYFDVVERASDDPIKSTGRADDTFAIFYTSGTTGLPKGAMVSHRNLERNGYNQIIADGALDSDVNLIATPLYHMGAVFMAMTYMLIGCPQIVLPRFTAKAWLRALEASGATVSLLVPTMINAILNNPVLPTSDLGSLRLIFYGGGPMPPAVLARAMHDLKCGFTQGYGLTETIEATFLVDSDHVRQYGDHLQRVRLNSAGREAVGVDVRVVNEHGNDVMIDEVGEIIIRSESVIKGYWNAPEETARAIRNGWFYTGDLGYFDAGRYLFVVDRKKDMIVSGGENVYTKEVEAVLYQHPDVIEAAVVGLPDQTWGEIVAAVVVRRAGSMLDTESLVEYCRKSLASYKKPRRIIFVDELPKNPSGKILKRELRNMLSVSSTSAGVHGDAHC